MTRGRPSSPRCSAAHAQAADPLEAGLTSVTTIVAVGFAMIFFVALANLVIYQYAEGVVRTALDDGARAQSPAEAPPGACYAAVQEAFDSLLDGPMGDGISITCIEGAGQVVARATGTFPKFSPLVPDLTIDMSATAVKEVLP